MSLKNSNELISDARTGLSRLVARFEEQAKTIEEMNKTNVVLNSEVDSLRLAVSILRGKNASLVENLNTAEKNFNTANLIARDIATERNRIRYERDEAVKHAVTLAQKYDKDNAELQQQLAEAQREVVRIREWVNGAVLKGIDIRIVP